MLSGTTIDGDAAWLAGGHEQFLQFIVRSEPELLLRSDVARLDDGIKAALVAAVFERVAKEQALELRSGTQFYSSLAHPGLTDQLRAVIADKDSNILLIRLALDIAAACGIGDLTTDLLQMLNDPGTDPRLIHYIARTVAEIAPEGRKQDLIPLAFHPDEEVKGSALRAVIPTVWKVRDALPCLTFDSETLGGLYWIALHYHLPSHVEPDDVVDGLEYIIKCRGCFDTLHLFNKTADRIFVEAIAQLKNPTVRELFVTAWLSKAREYLPLPLSKEYEFYEQAVNWPEKRISLIRAILYSPQTTADDVNSLELFEIDDLPWVLQQLQTANGSARILGRGS